MSDSGFSSGGCTLSTTLYKGAVSPDHPVMTDSGRKKAGDIKAGDKVIAVSRSGSASVATVTDVFSRSVTVDESTSVLSWKSIERLFYRGVLFPICYVTLGVFTGIGMFSMYNNISMGFWYSVMLWTLYVPLCLFGMFTTARLIKNTPLSRDLDAGFVEDGAEHQEQKHKAHNPEAK